MDKLAAVIVRLDRVQFPSDISFHRGGQAIATAVRPAGRDAEQSYQSRIWRYDLGGAATQLTHGPNGVTLPWSRMKRSALPRTMRSEVKARRSSTGDQRGE